MAVGFGGMLLMFGLQPYDDNVHICGSPLYHTAVLVFAGAAIHIGHTVVLMDKWTPEQMLHLIDKYQVTNTHMVPTQFVRLLGLPEDDAREVRRVVAAPHGARGRAVPARREAPDDRVVGPGHRRVLRGDARAAARSSTPTEWLEHPGTVGRAWPTRRS